MSGRRKLVSGNWKMHHTHLEAIAVVQKLAYALDDGVTDRVDVSLHPPFTALRSVQTVLESDKVPIALGAQDVHWEGKGAFTGEISPPMLAKLNVRYVIVGHSERRAHFGETDEIVNKKVRAVVGAGMTPVVCVGEDLEARDAGATEDLVVGQLLAALAGVDPTVLAGCVVAYEPLWAIGSGRSATPDDAQSVAAALRAAVTADHGAAAGQGMRVQYGGSVSPDNVAELVAGPDVDGVLVGGASLDADTFARLIAAAAR
ncbi:MAG TPA: triose-phosphate isomerase [Acidimicrobiales bacterium]|nr:triose-phosphate isomerase [Acidimicrobiales bacterium]